MKNWDEGELEKFIRENKDKFNKYPPHQDHAQHFLRKLTRKFKEVIDIMPYLAKAGIVTLLIFIISFFLWKAYLCPPLTRVSIKYWKVEHGYTSQIKRNIRMNYRYITNPDEREEFDTELQKLDETFKNLRQQLRKDPSEDNIAKMLRFYKDKMLRLQENAQYHQYKNPGKN
jgi:hypothetical protein